MRVSIASSGTISLDPAQTDYDLEMLLDRVTEELIDRGAQEVSIGASLTQHQVEISLTLEADSLEEGLILANDLVRESLTAAGLSTPSWKHPDVPVQWESKHLERA